MQLFLDVVVVFSVYRVLILICESLRLASSCDTDRRCLYLKGGEEEAQERRGGKKGVGEWIEPSGQKIT